MRQYIILSMFSKQEYLHKGVYLQTNHNKSHFTNLTVKNGKKSIVFSKIVLLIIWPVNFSNYTRFFRFLLKHL